MPLGHDVVAEARCNWYLRDINICSLSRKNSLIAKTKVKFHMVLEIILKLDVAQENIAHQD
jgi:hypothetical protein